MLREMKRNEEQCKKKKKRLITKAILIVLPARCGNTGF